jgi:hypothetical protein
MRQLSFAADKPAAVSSYGENVVPFDMRQRTSRVRLSSADRPRLPEGAVVRFPLANGESRQKGPRAEQSTGQVDASRTNEPRFTTFDFVATAFLILSVFAGPALVWSLLRSASFIGES